MNTTSISEELGQSVKAVRGLFMLEGELRAAVEAPQLASEYLDALSETVLQRLERAAAMVEQVELQLALESVRDLQRTPKACCSTGEAAAAGVSPDVDLLMESKGEVTGTNDLQGRMRLDQLVEEVVDNPMGTMKDHLHILSARAAIVPPRPGSEVAP